MTRSKVVIIRAYSPTDFFTGKMEEEYDNFLCENGTVPKILMVHGMYFENTPFPEKYTYDTLENSLKQCVDVIKNADIVTVFTTLHNDKNDPLYELFLNRLFHLKEGCLNRDIWNDTDMGSKKLRLVRVFTHLDKTRIVGIDEMKGKFRTENPSTLDSKYRLMGFKEIYGSMFRNFKNNIHEPYAQKYLKKIRELSEKDLYLGYQPSKNKGDN